MNYSKQYINGFANKTGFISSNIEKVIRLLDVLDFIFSQSSFKNALVLKGGTAINLIYANLNRLSVDIDLDYHYHLEKEKALEDRELILNELDNFMIKDGYWVSTKSRGSAILASRTYSYVNSSNNNDNIKVEINFIDHISLYPSIITKINYFDKSVDIASPVKEELYGMKLAAVIDRNKPRDLYDTYHLFKYLDDIDEIILKKSTIFYLSLDNIFEIDKSTFNGIESINQSAIKKELLPVLRKGEKFDLMEAQNFVIDKLNSLLTLTKEEKMYLSEFAKGNYNPYLLFYGEVSDRAAKHPMAIFRTMNNKNQNI